MQTLTVWATLALLAAPLPALAATLFFTDESAFLSAVGSGPDATMDYEGILGTAPSLHLGAGGVTYTEDGISITALRNIINDTYFPAGDDRYKTGRGDSGQTEPNTASTISYTGDIYAGGAWLYTVNNDGYTRSATVGITLSNGDSYSIVTPDVDGDDVFIGFLSDVAVESFTLAPVVIGGGADARWLETDDITVWAASTVPLSGTLLLMGAGLTAWRTRSKRALIAVVVLLATVPAHAATITFSAGDFDTWHTETASGELNGQVGTPHASGGNPGGYLNVETVTRWATVNAHLDSAFVYDPSLGAINSITASLDFNVVSAFGQGQGISPIALVQDGLYFRAGNQISGTLSGWTTIGPQVFTASDFVQFGGSGGALPDFSTSGSTITFGFMTNNSAGNGISVDYDNFLAVLDVYESSALPGPGTAALLFSGVFGLRRTRPRG
ncbi:MAG: hypothetical protein ACPGU7_14400 [Gammaproteobacteria bacterium]